LILHCEPIDEAERFEREFPVSLGKANGADQEILYPNQILNCRVWAGEYLI
jgi:hypothetical protein